MANNYMLFSEAIKKPTKRELAWLLKEHNRRSLVPDRDETMGDFQFNIEMGDAYVFSDESGNVDHAADFVQEFLKKFRPDSCFHIEWAATCSLPRAGEFGGGAIFITAKKMTWFNSSTFVEEELKKFEKSNRRKRKA